MGVFRLPTWRDSRSTDWSGKSDTAVQPPRARCAQETSRVKGDAYLGLYLARPLFAIGRMRLFRFSQSAHPIRSDLGITVESRIHETRPIEISDRVRGRWRRSGRSEPLYRCSSVSIELSTSNWACTKKSSCTESMEADCSVATLTESVSFILKNFEWSRTHVNQSVLLNRFLLYHSPPHQNDVGEVKTLPQVNKILWKHARTVMLAIILSAHGRVLASSIPVYWLWRFNKTL